MRLAAVLAALALVIWAGSVQAAQVGVPALQTRLARSPYDYEARRELVEACRRDGDHASAYYQAAWLAWLAPRSYAESGAGLVLLRDQRARDRAAVEGKAHGAAAVVAAMDGRRAFLDSCLNGAIVQQASRVRADLTKLIAVAEEAEGRVGRADPVARSAIAQLYLLLDACLVFEDTPESRRARPRAVQKAVSLATTVAAWLPESPGAHRMVAVSRARQAELENRTEWWEVAVEASRRAAALDPEDARLSEMVRALHLRAGQWSEARRWERGGPPREGGE